MFTRSFWQMFRTDRGIGTSGWLSELTHHIKVVIHGEQSDECGNNLLNREACQSIFVAHDEHLTHFDHRLQLLTLIANRLKSRQELLSFRSCKAKKLGQSHAYFVRKNLSLRRRVDVNTPH